MLSAMLLTISVAALAQFAAYYWRAIVAGVAAQPVSERVLEAARVENGQLGAHDFDLIADLHSLTLDLNPAPRGLGFVPAYFQLVRFIGAAAKNSLPSIASWSERERVLCARYAAVQMDRRLQSNLAMAAALRSC